PCARFANNRKVTAKPNPYCVSSISSFSDQLELQNGADKFTARRVLVGSSIARLFIMEFSQTDSSNRSIPLRNRKWQLISAVSNGSHSPSFSSAWAYLFHRCESSH